MEPNIIDLLATNAPASDISDAIKSSLYAKSMEKLDQIRPLVANEILNYAEDEAVNDEATDTEDQE